MSNEKDYDWIADATGSWADAVDEAKRRAAAGEPQIPYFTNGYRFPSDGAAEYRTFLNAKTHCGEMSGFAPLWIPDFLFDFQRTLLEWAIRKGRAAIFADCGLGKGPMQLAFAENVVRKTGGKFLILAPLAVSQQFEREGAKFGIECRRSTNGRPAGPISVTNYEKLHLFDPADYVGVSCDESSAIKHFTGARQRAVTDFLRKLPYRLLCSATPSPNDYIELGTASEALGEFGRMDMLGKFFRNDEDSLYPQQKWHAKWRFKKHAEADFWRWVSSWARALRKPSDLGGSDAGFVLPPLIEEEQVVVCDRPFDGQLFTFQAATLDEQRQERRLTLTARCERVAELLSGNTAAVAWCGLNAEGDLLTKLIPDAEQISGHDTDERKEEVFASFADGSLKKIITKPTIGGFGLNWQHCHRMTFFPSHSFEQYYQAIRRCWRFGQTHPVKATIVTTEGELRVLYNIRRKAAAADALFTQITAHMRDALMLSNVTTFPHPPRRPSWL